jgi:hypothetical protein
METIGGLARRDFIGKMSTAPLIASVPSLSLAASGDAGKSVEQATAKEGAGFPSVDVYFGCGCFWHMQYFLTQTEKMALRRNNETLTSRTAYAGGTGGPQRGGLVCYHNLEFKADYGKYGHTEVVAFSIPEPAFGFFADTFWMLCPNSQRHDPQDRGGEYRSAVGIPGGITSPLMPRLREKAGGAKLVAGNGDEGDTLGTGIIYVYDTMKFPAHIAEKYHQFHNDMTERYPREYNGLRQYAKKTECPGDRNE